MAPSLKDMAAQLTKFESLDPDIRYMALVDLVSYLEATPRGFLSKENQLCANLIDGLLKLLDDSNGDVQSQALKCIGPLAIRSSPDILAPFISKLTLTNVKKSQDLSIPSTATRYLITALPRPVTGIPPTKAIEDSYSAVSRVMIPRLLGYIVIPIDAKAREGLTPPGMLEISPDVGVDVDAVDLLNETVRCFGPLLKDVENEAILKKLWQILEDQTTGSIGKKKAISGLSILAIYLSDDTLSKLVSNTIESLRASHLAAPQRRLLIAMIGSVARAIPQRLGSYLKMIAPFVLQALSQEEYDELLEDLDEDGIVNASSADVREAALITLEDIMSSCVNEMRPFTEEAIDANLRYLSFDPNMIVDFDEEMNGTDEDDFDASTSDQEEDFEEEGLDDDDDDSSWKIRRCAAKSLLALISTRFNDLMENGALYEKIAPFLVKRFSDREENVRLEVLSTMALIIRRTAAIVSAPTFSSSEPASIIPSTENTKKRRRGGSDASMFDGHSANDTPGQTPSPVSGARAELTRLGPSIIQAILKLFTQKSVPTKQALIILLREYANMKHGGLSEHLGQIIEPVVGIIKTTNGFAGGPSVISTGGSASATGNSLRMESLNFLLVLCDTHSSRAIAPYLDMIVPGVVSAVDDKYFKVSCTAIGVTEGILKLVTPPRSLGSDQKSSGHIRVIYGALANKARANDSDLEVRQRAIHALGVCLMRTSGSVKLFSKEDREEALMTLDERLRSETTRLDSVEAIQGIASASVNGDLNSAWVNSIAQELSNQLRKSDIRLRACSLGALKQLSSNRLVAEQFDAHTIQAVTENLIPLLSVTNLGTLGLGLNILTNLTKQSGTEVIDKNLTASLCLVVTNTLSGPTLDAFLDLLSTIGDKGAGQSLMQELLQKASIRGDPTVVGPAIGALIVSGKSSVGVGLKEILEELKVGVDDQRRCLSLCILGEVGLRQGSSSSLQPETFLEYFKSKSDQVRQVAALSLGRAGAGNTAVYLPVIINELQIGKQQPLLLHSVKEILQYAGKAKANSSVHMDTIWEEILKLSNSEDNRAIGAECIGRLVGFDPKKYLPSLQAYLLGPVASIRGLSIQAVRFALGDSDRVLDDALKPVLVQLLVTMLSDDDLENRRLALTTLNSAVKHKPATVLRNLSQLVPFVIKATTIDPSLIRDVQMGPFKHKVDDGLENRKSAYETLYALMTAAYSRLHHLDLFDRVVDGLGDDYDIKTLSNLMLTKLIVLDPDETSRRLDSIGEKFQATLSTKLKESAVKQEVEKLQEAAKDVLRTTVHLQNSFPGVAAGIGNIQMPLWRNYCDHVNKEFAPQLKAAEDEVKMQA